MKDKRQKMTLSWPCGDPVLAAYVLQAAAASGQLPYPGLFAAAAAASPFGLLPPRPPHPPPPGFPPQGMPCRPTPTLIPPPPGHQAPAGLHGPVLNPMESRSKSPIEEVSTSEDESKKTPGSDSNLCLQTSVHDKKSSGAPGSLFQPYLDLEKK